MAQIRNTHNPISGSEYVSSSSVELARQYRLFADEFLVRHLLDALPGMVLILNKSCQIIFANKAFLELTGSVSSEMFCGHMLGDVLSCHIAASTPSGCGQGDSCETCGALASMLSDENDDDEVHECVIARRDGDAVQNLSLRIWTAPLDYADESFMILAGTDISHERRRLALEKTFFHDIMNLVGSIRGFAEILEMDGGADSLDISQRIQGASQRVIDEIDAQRVLLAAEKDELILNKQPLNSLDLLQEVKSIYEGHDLASGRVIAISEGLESCSFISDATLVRRILGNMVKNALEATAKGGTITFGSDVSVGSLSFWVHNEAMIPKVYQQRIFQRDFSTKGQGRGLGTYGMQLLARFLDGDVSFTSSEQAGTRFVLTLLLNEASKGI